MMTTRERKESVSTDNNENKNDIIKPENVIARLAQCKPLKSVNPASYHEGRNDRCETTLDRFAQSHEELTKPWQTSATKSMDMRAS